MFEQEAIGLGNKSESLEYFNSLCTVGSIKRLDIQGSPSPPPLDLKTEMKG